MKKAVLLASLAVLSPSWSASALQEGVRRSVSVAGNPAGMITAFYVASVNGPLGTCLYDIDWESPFLAAGSVMCQLAEQKVLGHTSCLMNRMSLFAMVVGESFPSRIARIEGILRLISTRCVMRYSPA